MDRIRETFIDGKQSVFPVLNGPPPKNKNSNKAKTTNHEESKIHIHKGKCSTPDTYCI